MFKALHRLTQASVNVKTAPTEFIARFDLSAIDTESEQLSHAQFAIGFQRFRRNVSARARRVDSRFYGARKNQCVDWRSVSNKADVGDLHTALNGRSIYGGKAQKRIAPLCSA